MNCHINDTLRKCKNVDIITLLNFQNDNAHECISINGQMDLNKNGKRTNMINSQHMGRTRSALTGLNTTLNKTEQNKTKQWEKTTTY